MAALGNKRAGHARTAIFVLSAVLALVLLWRLLAPAADQAPASAPVAQAHDWVVRDGHRVSGPERVAARIGEHLLLRVRSDRADELHIHGYEISRDLPANHLVVVELPLTRSGRFEIELHAGHQLLTVLEVQPR